jgi:hypothetical protein
MTVIIFAEELCEERTSIYSILMANTIARCIVFRFESALVPTNDRADKSAI